MGTEVTWVCEKCEQELDAQFTGPCPKCENESRVAKAIAWDSFGIIDQVKGTVTEPEEKHWGKQFEAGEEAYSETNEIRTVIRAMDYKNRHDPDSYYEDIKNWHTKEPIKQRSQSFAEHQGHGSAKNKIPEFPEEWVRVAAYYIWEKEGCKDGRHINHWNNAKSQLRKMWKEGYLPKPDERD
jgi:DUF2934 family protein